MFKHRHPPHMRLFCCYTRAHEILYRQVFLPSVPKGFPLHSTLIDEPGAGDFLSPEFLRCIRRKIEMVEASLQATENELLAWSDVDIRLVNLSAEQLAGELANRGVDILFQRESPRIPDVNTGFFVCRPTDAVRSFFVRVRQQLDTDTAINEQMAVNRLLSILHKNELPLWGSLPPSYYARTHGWPPPRHLMLYHANYTKGPHAVGQKLAQFTELDSILRGGSLARWWSILRRVPTKLLSLARAES